MDPEVLRALLAELNLTPEEVMALDDLSLGMVFQMADEIVQEGYSTTLTALELADWEEKPVSPEQFFTDPYYLGKYGATLFPLLKKELVEICGDPEVNEVICTGSIGWGKCVSFDTEVYDVSSGRRRRVDELGSFRVASMDREKGGQIRPAEATAYASGEKECLELVLADGRSVVLSVDHPVFVGREGAGH